MDIFKELSEQLSASIKTTKEKKVPVPRIQKNKNGKILYLIVRDSELLNKSGNATHVTLIKLPLDTHETPTNLNDLIARFGTDEAKSGKYTITDTNYKDLIANFKPFNDAYKIAVKKQIHDKEQVIVANKTYDVCSVASKVHEAVELLDTIENIDDLNVIEGQEIHQAMYRLKLRMEAVKMPDSLFNEYLFKNKEKARLEHLRAKRSYNLLDKGSLIRFAEASGAIVQFADKNAPKRAKQGIPKTREEYLSKFRKD